MDWHKYCRRNVIWTMVSGLVLAGMTAAIDAIYAVYEQQTCVIAAMIIDAIKRDMKGGMLNPNLRV